MTDWYIFFSNVKSFADIPLLDKPMIQFSDTVGVTSFKKKASIRKFAKRKKYVRHTTRTVRDKVVRPSWPTAEPKVRHQLSITEREEYAQQFEYVDWSMIPRSLKKVLRRMRFKRSDLCKPCIMNKLRAFVR